jgi:hypothetical protein
MVAGHPKQTPGVVTPAPCLSVVVFATSDGIEGGRTTLGGSRESTTRHLKGGMTTPEVCCEWPTTHKSKKFFILFLFFKYSLKKLKKNMFCLEGKKNKLKIKKSCLFP